jgi:hypothetical protein
MHIQDDAKISWRPLLLPLCTFEMIFYKRSWLLLVHEDINNKRLDYNFFPFALEYKLLGQTMNLLIE